MKRNSLINIKKIALLLSVVFVLGLGMVALSGCKGMQSFTESNDVVKAQTTAYVAQVKEFSSKVNIILENFQTDMKDKNIDGMSDKIDGLDKLMGDFDKLDVPKDCEDVQASYKEGFNNLHAAFKDYYLAYRDYCDKKIKDNELNQKVRNIQHTYDQGVESIKRADEKLANM